MKKIKKIIITFLIIGLILVPVGFIIGGNFQGVKEIFLIDHKYELQEKIYFDNINEINLNINDRNIEVIKSDESNYIEYYLYNKKETATLDNNKDVLSFTIKNKKSILSIFKIGYTTKKVKTIKIYLNDDNINNFNVNLKVGNFKIEDEININNFNFITKTANLELINTNIDTLKINNNTGVINLKNINSLNTVIEQKVGNVNVENIDGNFLNIQTTTGNIKINNNKVTQTNISATTGKIEVIDQRAKENIGFIIKVNTGKINFYDLEIKEKNDNLENFEYKYTLTTTTGNIIIK